MLTDSDAVAAALGRPLDAAEETRVEALIVVASAAIESETGRRFSGGPATVGRIVRCGRVELPSIDVEAVTAVRALDRCTGETTELTGYTVRGNTVYGLAGVCYVEVDYVAEESVPAEIAGVAAGMVAATISSPPVGATSEQTGPFGISYVNSSGRPWFSTTDRLILAKYTRTRSVLLL